MTPEEKLFAAMHLRHTYPKQLAKAANLQDSVFSHMRRYMEDPNTINPRKMSPHYAAQIAPHLGVTPEWFFDGRDCEVLADLLSVDDRPDGNAPIGAKAAPAPPLPPASEIRTTLDSDVHALFEAALLFVGEDDVRTALQSLYRPRSSVQPGRRDHGFSFHTSNPSSSPSAKVDVDDDGPEVNTPGTRTKRG